MLLICLCVYFVLMIKETAAIVLLLLLLLGIILTALVNIYSNNWIAYAHNFSPNTLSTFITLVHRAEIELLLANNNFPSNVTLALDHGEKAVKLMDDAYYSDEDIIDDTDFIRRYNEALNSNNSTIHALVVANIVDQILREYGEAIDIGYDLTNMSNIMMMPMKTISNLDSRSSPSHSMDMNISKHSNIVAEENDNSTIKVVNMDNYQTAQQLSESVYEIFENQLRSLIMSSSNTNTNNTTAITLVEKSLFALKDSVNNKASAQDIMMLVHGQLHPNLQLAYDLKLKQ
jgi:hypothetical protein